LQAVKTVNKGVPFEFGCIRSMMKGLMNHIHSVFEIINPVFIPFRQLDEGENVTGMI
jgi:hypothetical protein